MVALAVSLVWWYSVCPLTMYPSGVFLSTLEAETEKKDTKQMPATVRATLVTFSKVTFSRRTGMEITNTTTEADW